MAENSYVVFDGGYAGLRRAANQLAYEFDLAVSFLAGPSEHAGGTLFGFGTRAQRQVDQIQRQPVGFDSVSKPGEELSVPLLPRLSRVGADVFGSELSVDLEVCV